MGKGVGKEKEKKEIDKDRGARQGSILSAKQPAAGSKRLPPLTALSALRLCRCPWWTAVLRSANYTVTPRARFKIALPARLPARFLTAVC